jgi:hypothetical protein
VLCASVESIKKWVLKPFCPEVRIPVTKGLLRALIEHLSTHLQDAHFSSSIASAAFWQTAYFAVCDYSLSGKLFVIQETVDVLDPVTSWATFTFADSPSHKCLSHFIIVLLWHDWEQKGWNCQRCSDSD